MNDLVDVAVIGAGISGLAAAYRASTAGATVALFEGAPTAGGVVSTVSRNDFLIERATTSMSASPAVVELLHELGLASDMVTPSATARKRFVLRNGTMETLPTSPGALLRTPLLSARGKLRLLAEPFIARQPAGGDDESLGALTRRRLGPEVLDYFVDPFVSGVCAGAPDTLSSRHTMRTLTELEQRHGSIVVGALKQALTQGKASSRPRIISFARGMQQLPDAIMRALGRAVYLNERVESVSRVGESWELSCRSPGGVRSIRARALVCAAPAGALLGIGWPAEWDAHIHALSQVRHAPVLTIALGFRRRDVAHALDGFGVLFPHREKQALLGALFNSSMFPGRAGTEHVLVTAFAGGVRTALEPLDSQAISAALRVLGPLLGLRGDPVMAEVSRWEQGIPQLELGHERLRMRAAAIEIAAPNVFFIGSYLGGVALGDCLEHGIHAGNKAADAAKGLHRSVLGRSENFAGAAAPL